jgi:hypothetical protein
MSTYPNDPLESPWKYDGTYQARHLALLDLIRIACGNGGGGGGIDLSTVEALLTSIDSKDFSTEATLEAVRVLIESLDGKDYATQTTLQAIYDILNAGTVQVDTGLDLSPLATEATLQTINTTLTEGITANVDTSELATKLNQYTELDLLNLIYEELQAQTKLLKKIYR